MPKTERIPTPWEKRIEELLIARSPPAEPYKELLDALQHICTTAIYAGMDAEAIALAAVQNAVAVVSTQKMLKRIRPELADALAEDFRVTVVESSIPGIPTFISPRGPKRDR